MWVKGHLCTWYHKVPAAQECLVMGDGHKSLKAGIGNYVPQRRKDSAEAGEPCPTLQGSGLCCTLILHGGPGEKRTARER